MLIVLKRGRRYVDHRYKDGTNYVIKGKTGEKGRGPSKCLKNLWLKG